MLFATVLAALAVTATAVPAAWSGGPSKGSGSGFGSGSSLTCSSFGRNYDDTFDGLSGTPGLDQGNLVDCRAGGALCYNAWDFSDEDPLTLTAPSSPNVILTALGSQEEEGQPSFYVNSTYHCFDLQSVYYAIGVNTEQDLVNVGETGTIQMTGVSACTGKTIVEELPFDPATLEIPLKFQEATFSDFTCLSTVNIELIQAAVSTSPLLATVFLDNISYRAYSANQWCSCSSQ